MFLAGFKQAIDVYLQLALLCEIFRKMFCEIILQIQSAKFMAVYDNNADLAVDNSQSFKYKAALAGKTSDYVNPNSFVKNAKLVVPLKYLRNF